MISTRTTRKKSKTVNDKQIIKKKNTTALNKSNDTSPDVKNRLTKKEKYVLHEQMVDGGKFPKFEFPNLNLGNSNSPNYPKYGEGIE